MTMILVLNAGSSSIKFAAYKEAASSLGDPILLQRGELAEIGDAPHLQVHDVHGKVLLERVFEPSTVADMATAERIVNDWVSTHLGCVPDAVGHRVVHGGTMFHEPIRVDAQVLVKLESLTPLAPLHQPFNLAPIRSLLKRNPDLPQVACFDTGFHFGHRPEMDLYALPQHLLQSGVRRYGFHGLSYEYIASCLPKVAPNLAPGRLVVAHLGNGASLCALHNGRSVDSTMGFSALEGLVMGTRPGNLDPGIVLYLMQERGQDATAISHLLYHDCGLKGLSGSTGDMRKLLEIDTPEARLAVKVFVHRIVQSVAAMAASMGGIDGLIFTAGIGEHASAVRTAIVNRLAIFNALIDTTANAANASDIAAADSAIALRVIPTDEELMIARHTLRLLQTS